MWKLPLDSFCWSMIYNCLQCLKITYWDFLIVERGKSDSFLTECNAVIIKTVVPLVLVVSKPWIRCPDLITQDLLTGKSTADVSSVWKGPTSNVEPAQITISPPEISSSYQFPYGTTKVTWTASNSEGSESCSIFVIIYGNWIFSSCQYISIYTILLSVPRVQYNISPYLHFRNQP